MFRLVVLSTVLAIAAAAPGAILQEHSPEIHHPAVVAHKEITYQKSIIEEPTYSHVGTVVKHVPTAVTHHSSSIIHHDAKISEPIFVHGVKKTVVETPVEKTVYHTVAAAPAVKTTYVEAAPAQTYVVAPVAKAVHVESAPVHSTFTKTTYVDAPVFNSAHYDDSSVLTYAAAKAAFAEDELALAHASAPVVHIDSYPGFHEYYTKH
ncbi:uncharacterized protein LOC129771271 [Toxorhynchites rutilus septentrionalis]|uniref:uncharacterized protein LOC129771271 n=1 Tax=Toxorhynchites rutilus septentrionalis TaxID=329112 RepID=UPI002479C18C|nr:uncharacterized protein LOC129771271 [Toxorhynchites rutilus septentrionalis]